MKQEIRNKIIAANQILTLEMAQTLVGKCVSICCKERGGEFADLVDTVVIQNVAKVSGKKNQHVLIDQYGGFSYHCNRKVFQNNNGDAVYFIAY